MTRAAAIGSVFFVCACVYSGGACVRFLWWRVMDYDAVRFCVGVCACVCVCVCGCVRLCVGVHAFKLCYASGHMCTHMHARACEEEEHKEMHVANVIAVATTNNISRCHLSRLSPPLHPLLHCVL